jgi:hypothetical protein
MSVRLRRPAGPEASGDGAGPVRALRRRRLAPVALAAAVLAAGGVAAMALLGGDEEGNRPGLRAAGQTATVTRQTLVERETVDGTLGYAGTRTVLNRLATAGGTDPGAGASGGTGSGAATPGGSGAAVAIPAAYVAQDDPAPGAETPPQETDEPSSGEPPSDKPKSGESPSGESPSGESPSGESPSGESPSSEAPSADSPTTEPSPTSEPSPQETPRSPATGGYAGGGSTAPESSGGSGSGGGGSTDPDPSTGSGTVTALPRPGSVVRRGGALYRVDGQPVVLMYGATPAFRDLELRVEDGRDVRQLEENLAALGFDPGTVDTEFTSSTAAAVSDWQESVGLPDTGTVELGRVVFLPGARRIGEHRTGVGSVLSAGSEVLDTSSTRRVVTIELDAALQSLARKGDRVEVTLPDQSTVRGRISDVGRVAREKEASDAADPAAGTEQELVIDVTVRLRSARGLGRLDEAPVSVGLAQESRKNVLAVPVEALVARRGGGYGVELAGGRRVVPVRTGLFAGGYVEVEGSGIREGARVVVPDA